MTSATVNLGEIAAFWRTSRRLYVIYAELDRVFELGLPSCQDLEFPSDRSEPEVIERVRNWFEQMDARVQVWQLRQLLQSTNLQTEENLRDLISRHMSKTQRTEIDRDKVDFLLVQYFAHCAPHGLYEQKITLEEVARVLTPVVGAPPSSFPDAVSVLDVRLDRLNECSSLEELQNSGALVEVRELKLAADQRYFEPAIMIAFTRFNFLARRAFFRAMHLDLHAIRESVNQLEGLAISAVDCSEAGLSDRESLEHIRHLIHQWKTPFRAPYSGGSSFVQLVQLRHVLDCTLNQATAGPSAAPAAKEVRATQPSAPAIKPALSVVPRPVASSPVAKAPKLVPPPQPKSAPKPLARQEVPNPPASGLQEFTVQAPPADHRAVEMAPPLANVPSPAPVPPAAPAAVKTPALAAIPEAKEDDYLQRCIADISRQVKAAAPKTTPSATQIDLAGCNLLIATWEAAAFKHNGDDPLAMVLRNTVAARTILQVSVVRHKKHESVDLGAAIEIAYQQVEAVRPFIAAAKEANNVDAAVNLAATTKRMLALIKQAEELQHPEP